MTTHTMPTTHTETRAGSCDACWPPRATGGATVARVALGAVMLPHGAQKLLGWFGGYGFAARWVSSPPRSAFPTRSPSS
jgi:hypothetical protein